MIEPIPDFSANTNIPRRRRRKSIKKKIDFEGAF